MSDVEGDTSSKKEGADDSSLKDADVKEDSAGLPSTKDVEQSSDNEEGAKSQVDDNGDNAKSDNAVVDKIVDDDHEPMDVEDVSPCASPAGNSDKVMESPKGSPMSVDDKERTETKSQDISQISEPGENEADDVAEESPENGKKAEAEGSADEANDDSALPETAAESSTKDVSSDNDAEESKPTSKEIISGDEDETSNASEERHSKEAEPEASETKSDDENKDEESENIERLKGDEETGRADAQSEDVEKEEGEGPIIVRVLGTTNEDGASDKEDDDKEKGGEDSEKVELEDEEKGKDDDEEKEDEEEDEIEAGNIVISEVKSCVEAKDSSNEESQSKVESKEDEDAEEDKVDADKALEDETKDKNEENEEKPEVMDVEEEEEDEKKTKKKDDEKESEMPTLEILDVRTVTEEESSTSDKKNEEADESNDTKDAESNDDEAKTDKDASLKSDSSEKSSGIDAIANKLTKKTKKSTDDSEMKNYAADTMNELLGLFGYDKVDETMKDAIQLSDNLSGPSEKDGKKVEGEKKEGDDATTKGDEKVESKADEKKENEIKEEKDGAVKDKASEKAVEKSTTGKTTGKTLQKRECSFCGKTKPCKYQVLMLGTTKFLCDDNCFKDFRTKQHIVTAPAIKDIIAQNRPITRSLMHPKDFCNSCHKEIKNGMGLLPGVGENKPLCSEECMKNYQATQGLKRACAQCGNHILCRSKCLTWEAMEFCNEECLGKYQSYLGSHCAYCNNAVQQTSLGKYCVRFGSDIKQFCSNGCLEEFKKGLKVCSYCQKDISSGTEGFLAPVGDKGQFKEFCSQSCMEKYETMGTVTPSQPSIEQCSVCNKVTSVKVEVTYGNKIHKLCSEPCIAAFRYANKINTSICDTCHKFFDLDVTCQLTIQFEGTSKRFCTKACMNVFVLFHRKVVPCSWCKVKKYNFDMIERVDSNNHVQLFCSLNCLSLFRVSLNATSSKRIQCDFCHQVKPAQYHLTMSDASIRNFCSYNCVMQFQGQFTGVTPVVAAPSPQPTTTRTTTATTQSGTPVISSVMSLAPGQAQTTTKQTVPSAVAVRAQALPVQTIAKTIVHKVVGTQTLTPTITQQVVIKQSPAKPQKNKMLMCRPMTQTKGVSCKPHPCHKSSQTDGEYRENPIFIPIPVPIFVPVPMRMYSTPVPFPVAFPLPIPVPIFIPTTKDSAQSIFKQIKEIQQKIPNNPFEADLILMAEMVAEDSAAKGKTKAIMAKKAVDGEQSSSNDAGSDKQEEGFVVESAIPDSCPPPNTFGDEVLQMALRMASGMEQPGDLENALSNQSQDLNSTSEENGSYLSARELRGQARNHKRAGSRGRGRGRKRARMDDSSERETESPTPVAPPPPTPPVATQFDFRPMGAPQLESNCVLKFSYGVNAWKHWVLQKNTQLEKASQTNRKLKLFKTDILQLSADELNYSLCLFIKEVRKPNGDEYAPDSIYYLCLGIQQYLFENGRIDNIFSDAYYEKFTECLNEVLQRYEATLTSDGCFLSRIEEEILWECKQLGAHSPHVLLNTLMYFNTKFFMLKSIDDHLQLSFSHILKHWKKTPGSTAKGSPGGRNVLLRYYPPSQIKDSPRRRKEAIPSYEQVENLDNPLRCPVKLYEFYLSKCPESIKNRNDIFYLYPERSCVPDSPVWYSTMSLGKETIAKMLQRIRMVREVGDNITTT